jgi:DnaJ-class molecular chaperone
MRTCSIVGVSLPVVSVCSSYRKFALKHHPLKNGDNAAAAAQFRLVAEAYDVLADRQWSSVQAERDSEWQGGDKASRTARPHSDSSG